ncbi:serine hydrolase, partial [Acidobacteria bacterium AH-259-L09]|nr:serine hydrolase [Acidobacteria bacterium AH-259-L09]
RSLGMDPARLEEFGRYNLSIPNSNWLPYAKYKGIIVIKNGWIIGEWYNVPEARDFKTYLSSNGKAFAMAAFGILADDSRRGKINTRIGLDSFVYDQRWLPEGFPLSDPLKKNITFRQIFDHTSGLCPERTASGENVEQGRNRWTDYGDWVVGQDDRWPQTKELYFTPGHPEEYPGRATWGHHAGAYSSVGFCHVGLVLKNIYHIPAREFLWQRLLHPLGFSGIDFHAPPGEDIQWFSAGGLRMNPREYARFAYLLLRDGRWKQDQIVPASWVQQFRASPKYPNIRSNVDGYFGDQYPKDMFRIAGSGINLAFMIPSVDLIALRTGRANNSMWNEVEQAFLKKLFTSVLNHNANAEAQSRLDPASLPGQIVVDADHPQWLQYNGGAPFFMCGPGDPEGFLYRGRLLPDGTREGDQMKLIEKLKGTAANCVYLMAVRSHGGDGDPTHNPFVGHDPNNTVNPKVLDQWEQWFSEMDRNGIVIYFFIYDDSAVIWNPKGSPNQDAVSPQEKKFIQELVNRFKHHKNLIWCIGEEYSERYTKKRVSNLARLIRQTDEYSHLVAVHQHSGVSFDFPDDPNIGQFAIQLGNPDPGTGVLHARRVHEQVLEAWQRGDKRYGLNMSELAHHFDAQDRKGTRNRSWAAAMGGAYVMVIGMDIATTPREFLEDCGRLVKFFESTSFYEMSPHDELGFGGTNYVLANPGQSYIAYGADVKDEIGIKALGPGRYDFHWYDIPTGRWKVRRGIQIRSSDQSWKRPPEIGSELA